MPLVNQHDGEEVEGCECGECIYGDTVSPEGHHNTIHLCYNANSENYMKVRGGGFECEDGETANENNS